MKGIGKKLILLSFALALIASAAAFSYLKALSKPKEAVKKRMILVAAENIPARTMIDKKMIKEVQVPEDTIFNDYLEDTSSIVGKYTKETILKDDGFRKDKLLDESGNELSFNVEENHRAVTVNVSGASGVADLIKPNDYVDIVVYLAEKKDGQTLVHPDIAKLALQNIKVLAVDKEMQSEDKKTETETEEKVPTTFLVTLSVPVPEIEKIVLAENIGSIKLVLRPLDKENNSETDGTTWKDLTVNTSTDPKESQEGGLENSNNGKGSNAADANNKVSYYTVKPGDTLRDISMAIYGDADKYVLIRDMNKIGNQDRIITGEVLKIPPLN